MDSTSKFLLFVLKIVKQLRFSKSMSVFEKTLSAACWKLVGALVMCVLLLCTYAHLGYLVSGFKISQQITNSLINLFNHCI